jgi:hypothetical protein
VAPTATRTETLFVVGLITLVLGVVAVAQLPAVRPWAAIAFVTMGLGVLAMAARIIRPVRPGPRPRLEVWEQATVGVGCILIGADFWWPGRGLSLASRLVFWPALWKHWSQWRASRTVAPA